MKFRVKEPPPKEFCLRQAQYCLETLKHEQSSWEWLFVWVMYEHWVENYWGQA